MDPRTVVIVGLLCTVAVGERVALAQDPARPKLAPRPYVGLEITGETASQGLFDPSLEQGGADELWMTYTAIELEERGNGHSLGLALSRNGGRTWRFVARIADARKGVVTLNGRQVSGNWRNEVSTLVHDKDDPDPSRRWKLFWHKYFMKPPYREGDRLARPFGWIAYKCAASPPALAHAVETRLFGNHPAPLDPSDGRSPYPVKHYLNRLHRDLDGYLAFTEPGALARQGILYLSVEGIPPVFENRRIFLLSSDDHGKTWQYRGVLLDRRDAIALKTPILTASSLFEHGGKVFVLVTPVTPKGHSGLLLLEIEDLRQSKIRRDDSGHPVLIKRIPPFLAGVGGAGGGAGDFDSGKRHGGIVMCAVDVPQAIKMRSKKGAMKIFDTLERIPEEPKK